MNVLGVSALAFAAAALAASAAPAQPAPNDKSAQTCFFRNDVNGFTAPNDHTVYIRVGVNQVYRLDLMTDCINMTFAQHLGLEDQPASPTICSPLEATVIVRDGPGLPQHCPVKEIRRLTPEGVAGLGKYKP